MTVEIFFSQVVDSIPYEPESPDDLFWILCSEFCVQLELEAISSIESAETHIQLRRHQRNSQVSADHQKSESFLIELFSSSKKKK